MFKISKINYGCFKAVKLVKKVITVLYLSGPQYDGGNVDKDQWLRFPPKLNEAMLNIIWRRISLDPNIQYHMMDY